MRCDGDEDGRNGTVDAGMRPLWWCGLLIRDEKDGGGGWWWVCCRIGEDRKFLRGIWQERRCKGGGHSCTTSYDR